MQHPPATPSNDSPRLLFVVGMWRSGTSLIHALLNRHSQIALMYEAEPLEMWPRSSGIFQQSDWPRRLEFFNQTFSRHRLDPAIFAATPPGPQCALALYSEYARHRSASIFGEKAPSYHTQLPALGDLFPDARFLVVWRDPVDCCRSAKLAARKNRFFAQRGMLSRMLLGAETFALGVEKLLRDDRRVCQVVYDELVKNPEGELRRVCEFLNVTFEPAMLDLHAADVSSVPSGEHHEGVRSGVIGKTARAEDILAPDFTAKGRRYANRWRTRFGELDFARALPGEPGRGPGTVEKWLDGGVRHFWRVVDGSKKVIFRNIPLSWWTRLRSRSRH